MNKCNAISTTGRRSRFLTAIAVLALLGAVPAATVGAASNPAKPASTGAAGVVAAPAQAVAPQATRPVARLNPDQVPLVAHTGLGSGARLVVSAPARVALGQTITIVLKATGVKNLAGYEGVLRFDGAAAQFDGLAQRAIALAGSGRDVEPLGPVVIPAGVAFGLYSCSIAGCGDGSTRTAAHPGASGTVTLAKLTLTPTAAGNLSIGLGSMRFVDASGKALSVRLPGSITIKVGSASKHFAAPAAPALRPGSAHPVTSADISGDGFVGPADLNSAAIAWGLARESGQACGLVNDPADVNHDGCLDVQDLQLIAARVAARPALAPGFKPAVADTFTVNSTSDAVDKTPGNGICATAANVCSLRAAITEANLHAGPDTILFNIPGSGVQTITIGSALPTITDTTGGVTIDGYLQPGASVNTDPAIDNAVIMVQVVASNPNTDGMFISSANNVIRGLSMYHMHRAITFQTVSAKNNAVTGSFIGTNAAGTFFAPGFISGGNGINVTQAASGTIVGGTDPADRNVISGNEANGFSTYDEQTDHNVVEGNLIGLAPNGQPIRSCTVQCYGQVSHGVDINNGSSYNIIGGTSTGQRNVISNNRGEGIEFSHGSTTDSNQAIGNYIGTDVTGNAGAANKFGNGLNGIHLEDGVTNDVLAFNVIANNGQRADGSEVMGGIGIEGFYTSGAWIHDNMIGVGADGATPLPNGFFGVDVHFNASWVAIGPNNIIANNPSGVIVSDASDLYNTISQNSIFNNGSTGSGRGIQLSNHSNSSIAVPTLSPSGVSLTAADGAACAGCTVEVFKATPNVGDASGGTAGQGKVFLGSTLVPASGAFTVGFSPTLNPGDPVTATVTDPAGDTSQFSTNVAAASASPTPPPTPAPTPTPTLTTYAADTFSRTLSSTWGKADIGGAYAGFYCTNDDMNVTGSAATVLVPDPHNPEICPKDSTVDTAYRGGYLTNVSAQDLDVRFRVKTSTLSTSDNQNVAFDVRRVSGFTSYRGQVRLTPTNQVWLQADTVVNNVITGLGSNTKANGVTVATSAYIWVRGQVTTIDPSTTQIRMKAWNDGSPEPSTWTLTVTDNTPVLQAPGPGGVGGAGVDGVGLVAWLSPLWNQGPITETFDDFNVTSPISGTVPDAPIADFSSAQVGGTLDVNFTDTSTGGPPSDWWWDFGDGSNSTSGSPTHSYAVAGTYTVKLITTNDGGTTSKTRTVIVDPLAAGVPAASFSAVQQPATLGVQFSDTSTNTPTSWSWNFGDGSPLSTSQNPLHTYPAAGSYAVTLDATNANGTGTTTQGVVVNPLPLPGATYVTVTPNRIVDSRSAKGLPTSLTANVFQTFNVTNRLPLDSTRNIPNTAIAVTGNLTVAGQTAPGYFALGPIGTDTPLTSTLNFPLNDNRANGVTVPLAAGAPSAPRTLSITYVAKAGAKAHVIFDVTGYFLPDTSGSTYKVVTPNRIVDTRPPHPKGLLTPLTANLFQTFNVANRVPGDPTRNIPPEAVAVTGNLTVTGQTAPGYFAITTEGTDTPLTSTLNFPLNDNRANGLTVPLGAGSTLNITYVAKAGAKAQVIFDVTGYFLPDGTGASYVVVTPNRIVDSRSAKGLPSHLVANLFQTFNVTNRLPLDSTRNIPNTAIAVTGNLTVAGQTAPGFFSLGPIGTDAPGTSTLNFPLNDNRANGVTVPLAVGAPGTLSVTYGASAGATAQVIFDVTGYFLP